MCGRYALSHSAADLQALFQVGNPEEFDGAAHYNIAPTRLVPLVFLNSAGLRQAGQARWGLVPHWVKEPGEWKASTFNARSEDAAGKPTYRQAFRRGRVLIPASGFYEWKRVDGGKQPYHVRAKDGGPLALAGLMDVWRSKEGDERLVSCTILTTDSSGPLAELHHRMPLMVPVTGFEGWLASPAPEEELQRLRAAQPLERLEVYPVSRAVNSAANDDPSFVSPLGG